MPFFRTRLPKGHIDGLNTGINAIDPSHDIDVSPGQCRDYADGANLVLESTYRKRFDAAWSVGNNAGAMLSGTIGANEKYGVWLIGRSDDGTVDVGVEAGKWLPDDTITLPTNYDQQRLIGFVATDGSSDLRPYQQIADQFWYNPRVFLVNDTTITDDTAETVDAFIPGLSLGYFQVHARNDTDNEVSLSVGGTGTTTTVLATSADVHTLIAAAQVRAGSSTVKLIDADGLLEYVALEPAGTISVIAWVLGFEFLARSNPYLGA